MTNKIKYETLTIECDSQVSQNPDSKGPDRLEITMESRTAILRIINDLDRSRSVILDKNGMEFLAGFFKEKTSECG